MPNIFKRFTRHVLILPGQNAAANLIQRWLCNRMVSRNLVRTLHTTSTHLKFSITSFKHTRSLRQQLLPLPPLYADGKFFGKPMRWQIFGSVASLKEAVLRTRNFPECLSVCIRSTAGKVLNVRFEICPALDFHYIF